MNRSCILDLSRTYELSFWEDVKKEFLINDFRLCQSRTFKVEWNYNKMPFQYEAELFIKSSNYKDTYTVGCVNLFVNTEDPKNGALSHNIRVDFIDYMIQKCEPFDMDKHVGNVKGIRLVTDKNGFVTGVHIPKSK